VKSRQEMTRDLFPPKLDLAFPAPKEQVRALRCVMFGSRSDPAPHLGQNTSPSY